MEERIRLGDLCYPSTGNVRLPSDEIIDYIDISSVDNKAKKIIGYTTYSFQDAPSRARKAVHLDDIIVSTVRPNLNAVAYYDSNTPNTAVVSTGFCVLSCKESVNPRFIFNFCKSKAFIDRLVDQATGASYPAVSDKIIRDVPIPNYSFSEQTFIAERLDLVQALIDIKYREIEISEQIIKSRFIEMFGDPVANPMNWPVKRLKDMSTLITNGTTPKGGSENYVESGYMFLRSQNVWRNRIELDDVAYIDESTHSRMKKSSLRYKDILITKTGRINTENSSLGRAALFLGEDDSANINGHVYLVRLDGSVVPEFVVTILTGEAYRKYIRKVCVGGIDKRQINVNHVEDFPIIQPPIEMQEDFASFIEKVNESKTIVQIILDKLKILQASLMQEYFG